MPLDDFTPDAGGGGGAGGHSVAHTETATSAWASVAGHHSDGHSTNTVLASHSILLGYSAKAVSIMSSA